MMHNVSADYPGFFELMLFGTAVTIGHSFSNATLALPVIMPASLLYNPLSSMHPRLPEGAAQGGSTPPT
jgi:hypothetical protein